MDGEPTPPKAVAPDDSKQPLLQVLGSLCRELPGLVSDRVQLLALELRRAGLALAQIIALVVAIGILAVTAWIAVWFVAAVMLLAWGLHIGWVLVIVLAINLGAAFLAARRVRSLVQLLGLPATVRRLTIPLQAPSTTPPATPPSMPSTATPDPA